MHHVKTSNDAGEARRGLVQYAQYLIVAAIGAYLRALPWQFARWRLTSLSVRFAPVLKAMQPSGVVTLPSGLSMHNSGGSQTTRMLFATGEYEPATAALLSRLLRPGDTLIDVGANLGFFSLIGSKAVGPGGKVIAFEPAADVREQLRRNLALNACSNVVVRDEALSEESSKALLYLGDGDSGLSSLRPLPGAETTTVTQARFDDISEGWGRANVVKIDVEGAELGVLKGMVRTLREQAPDLVVEVTDEYLKPLGGSSVALQSFLQQLGYSMFWISDDGGLVGMDAPHTLASAPNQFNALFTRRSSISNLLPPR